jgi:rhamnulokinase
LPPTAESDYHGGVTHRFLAVDLGAESGRAVLGRYEGGRLKLEEIHRFPNEILALDGRLHWNIYVLLAEVKKALKICAAEAGPRLDGLAVDTWGVDFGLVARDGTLLGLPYSYRELGNRAAMEAFFRKVGPERIYRLTGIQFLPFNSLFQLYRLSRDRSSVLAAASRLLFMPDLFHYLLTGRQATEYTIASTSQLLDPRTRTWSRTLLRSAGIPPSLLLDPVAPGTVLGPLLGSIAAETGLGRVPVIATATHDTAAAVAAVPADSPSFAYISSGTWSCQGVELSEPVVSGATLAHNFTNEGGVEGTIRLLKNVMGLWLVQGCRKIWARRNAYSYEELTRLAEEAPPFRGLIDPDAPDFLNPPDMPRAINAFLSRTGQAPLASPAAFVRAILESLALKYRFVVEEIREVVGRPVERLHIVGGGSKNRLLNRFTADATGLTVVAGPAEATSAGNILVQLKARRLVRDRAEMRAVVRASFPLRVYRPRPDPAWADAYRRFLRLPGVIKEYQKGKGRG